MNKNFNIQLFAENLNTTATMSKEMKTFYEKRLIDQAEPRLVHDQFADYYPVPQNGGKTIEFRKYDSLPKADTPLTEGVTPNAQALTVTPLTATVKQYGGWAAITDVLQLTAIDNNLTMATKLLGAQAGRTLDTITREYRGERVLVVGHQVIVNCLRYLLERCDEQAILAIDKAADVPNCGITSYAFNPALGRHGKLQLDLCNFVAPLEAAGTPVTAQPDMPAAPKS